MAVQVSGTATVSNATSESIAVYNDMQLYNGDRMAVADSSWVTLELDGNKHMLAEENTKLWLEASGKSGSDKTIIHLEEGSALIRIENKLNDSQSYEVHTPNSVISVRGTVFRVSVPESTEENSSVTVETFDGEVTVTPVNSKLAETDGTEVFKRGECGIVHGDGDVSKFVRSDTDDVHGSIDYEGLPKEVLNTLVSYIDDGEVLDKDRDYMLTVIGESVQTTEPDDKPTEEASQPAPETAEATTEADEPTAEAPSPHRHSGGTATCTGYAICTECGEQYGELAAHSFSSIWYSDFTNHWHSCTVCGAIQDSTAHYGADGVVCDTCGTKYGNTAEHNFGTAWVSNNASHWHECSHCSAVIGTTAHSGGTATCVARAKCEICGAEYGTLAAHKLSTVWSSNGTSHWYECTVCGKDSSVAVHSGGTATCQHTATCSVCGTEYGTLAEHSYRPDWSSNSTGHWHTCSVCGVTSATISHNGGTATCKTKAKCSVCGAEYGSLAAHSYGTGWYSDDSGHCHECTVCGAMSAMEPHNGKETCDKPAYCTICKFEYGTTGEHKYDKDTWSTDGTSHWHQCSVCGDKIDVTAHSSENYDCVTGGACDICGAFYMGTGSHSLTEKKYAYNDTGHYLVCTVCGAQATSAELHDCINITNPDTGGIIGQRCIICGWETYNTAVPVG